MSFAIEQLKKIRVCECQGDFYQCYDQHGWQTLDLSCPHTKHRLRVQISQVPYPRVSFIIK
jgi:hypothetical protein